MPRCGGPPGMGCGWRPGGARSHRAHIQALPRFRAERLCGCRRKRIVEGPRPTEPSRLGRLRPRRGGPIALMTVWTAHGPSQSLSGGIAMDACCPHWATVGQIARALGCAELRQNPDEVDTQHGLRPSSATPTTAKVEHHVGKGTKQKLRRGLTSIRKPSGGWGKAALFRIQNRAAPLSSRRVGPRVSAAIRRPQHRLSAAWKASVKSCGSREKTPRPRRNSGAPPPERHR